MLDIDRASSSSSSSLIITSSEIRVPVYFSMVVYERVHVIMSYGSCVLRCVECARIGRALLMRTTNCSLC
jgi:hypothetical protein